MLVLNKTLEMDTANLLLDRRNRKPIGNRRLSGSPKTSNGNVISLLSTPSSSKSISNRSEESKCITPQMRKRTFVAEESPSQDYEYFSPNRLSQEFESRDVEWEWGDKSSYSRKIGEEKKVNEPENKRTKQQRHLCSRRRSHHRQSREESRTSDQNRGFHKFIKEVEQLIPGLTNDNSSKESSSSALGEESRSKDLIKCTARSTLNYFETLPEQSDLQKAGSNCRNYPATAKADISQQCNLLDNSDLDDLLLKASQSAEEHIVKRGVTQGSDKKAARETSDVVESNEINSDGDSIDDFLLSIPDEELMKMTESGDKDTGYSSASQRGKSSFSRYNSMPPKPLERVTVSSTARPFIRHNSMPSDNASPSSKIGVSKSGDQKRICTKEEMEKKRLEAKKRQLISQRRRLLLNSKSKAVVLR